jgi:hypothetical protein
VRVVLALIACAGAALVLAGCGGSEDATQSLAREAVETRVAGDPAYETDGIRCTGNPRPWLVERQTTESICAVRRAEGGCDWFHVDLVPVGAVLTTRVRLSSPDAGCTLTG